MRTRHGRDDREPKPDAAAGPVAAAAAKRLDQFLTESVLLSSVGGLAGVLIGTTVTIGYAVSRGWDAVVPANAVLGGLAASLIADTLAGSYLAVRAARLSPTDALRA